MLDRLSVGAVYQGNGLCSFRVWAPRAQKLELHLLSPHEQAVFMKASERGYYEVVLDGVEPGSRYYYRIDGIRERPDPASRFQPQGVHGPSEVVDPSFEWSDGSWLGLPLRTYLIYEVHVGTFTDEGTFEAVIPLLGDLTDLGITALELMPVAQFPGGRNWGYDGVQPFAVQDTYGGPRGLKRLVDACHRAGLAVILDVAYNHLGPEGNYLAEFGPYFTDRYRTPWGAAVNLDCSDSMEVRRYFLANAHYWIDDFHIDSLRLDAVHAMVDFSARNFLEELAASVHLRAECLERPVYLIAESNQNDVRLVRPKELGGFGLDAQWSDDFHHSLHTLLTGERDGYYQDFGEFHHLVKAFREGFVYSGQYSRFRQRPHGSPSRDVPGWRLVVFAQNHDQTGNRILGDRLSRLVSFEELKLAAGAVLLSPFVPLLFMGEEYGETAPFQYFTSHLDANLVEAVRKGRREEFAAFAWQGEMPDPQSETTFRRSKLNRAGAAGERNRVLRRLYAELISLRKRLPSISLMNKEQTEVLAVEKDQVLAIRRTEGVEETLTAFNFGPAPVVAVLPLPAGVWNKLLDSAEPRWDGPGSTLPGEFQSAGEATLNINARSFAVFELQRR